MDFAGFLPVSVWTEKVSARAQASDTWELAGFSLFYMLAQALERRR